MIGAANSGSVVYFLPKRPYDSSFREVTFDSAKKCFHVDFSGELFLVPSPE